MVGARPADDRDRRVPAEMGRQAGHRRAVVERIVEAADAGERLGRQLHPQPAGEHRDQVGKSY